MKQSEKRLELRIEDYDVEAGRTWNSDIGGIRGIDYQGKHYVNNYLDISDGKIEIRGELVANNLWRLRSYNKKTGLAIFVKETNPFLIRNVLKKIYLKEREEDIGECTDISELED